MTVLLPTLGATLVGKSITTDRSTCSRDCPQGGAHLCPCTPVTSLEELHVKGSERRRRVLLVPVQGPDAKNNFKVSGNTPTQKALLCFLGGPGFCGTGSKGLSGVEGHKVTWAPREALSARKGGEKNFCHGTAKGTPLGMQNEMSLPSLACDAPSSPKPPNRRGSISTAQVTDSSRKHNPC